MPTQKDELEAGKSKAKPPHRTHSHRKNIGTLDWIVGGIAHDIKNFIASVSNYSDLILRNLTRNDPQRADVLEIKKSASRASALASYLIAFSRKEAVKLSLVDVNSVILDMKKTLRHTLGNQIELKLALGLDIGRMIAGPRQIEQVIMNLALNAKNAMPHGGTLRIETADVKLGADYVSTYLPSPTGDYVMLSVTDSGIGMTQQTQSHLFKPMFKSKMHGPRTGLGLATVHEIVKQNGGSIFVQSKLNHGSTFKICFPKAIKKIPR